MDLGADASQHQEVFQPLNLDFGFLESRYPFRLQLSQYGNRVEDDLFLITRGAVAGGLLDVAQINAQLL